MFERLSEGNKAPLLSDSLWREVIAQPVRALAHHAEEGDAELAELEWKRVYSELLALQKEGLRVGPTPALARIAFEAGAHVDARTTWLEAGASLDDPPVWMAEAFGFTEAYPQNLVVSRLCVDEHRQSP